MASWSVPGLTDTPVIWGGQRQSVSGVKRQNNILVFNSRVPLKSYLQIPCVFPLRLEVFPKPISEICINVIIKTNFEKLKNSGSIITIYHKSLESEDLQLEQTEFCDFPVFGKITKFSVFFQTENPFGHFPFSLCSGIPVFLKWLSIVVKRSRLFIKRGTPEHDMFAYPSTSINISNGQQ